MTNRILDRSSAPSSLWLLCLKYTCQLLNVLANNKLNGRTPTEKAFGTTPDISPFLQFHFYEEILYLDPSEGFPVTKEKAGRFVGVTDSIRDALTYWILTDTSQTISCSDIRPAKDGENPNLQSPDNAVEVEREDQGSPGYDTKEETVIRSQAEEAGARPTTIVPQDLMGTSYVDYANGNPKKATVTKQISDEEWIVKFVHGGEERRSYNQLINFINQTNEDRDGLWAFTDIIDHRCSTRNKWELQIKWDNNEITWEPLGEIFKTDAETVYEYGQSKRLLNTLGWKMVREYGPMARGRNYCAGYSRPIGRPHERHLSTSLVTLSHATHVRPTDLTIKTEPTNGPTLSRKK